METSRGRYGSISTTRSNAPLLHHRFWRKVHKTQTCWIWIGGRRSNGYGVFTVDGRRESAHRIAWELTHKTRIVSKLRACHHCDNPECVRPSHIFIGTDRDNALDMVRKGRGNWTTKPETVLRGERNGQAKLTAVQVHKILKAYAQGARQVDLAALFHISQARVSKIVRGEAWTHLTPVVRKPDSAPPID